MRVTGVDGKGEVYRKWHSFWDLEILTDPAISEPFCVRGSDSPASRHPVRSLRYWFMCHMIHKEYLAGQRSLGICEIGVGDGHMLAFMNTYEHC
jgi:hypothetical protein